MTIETLGVDIAKTVFQLHGVNRNGRLMLRRRVMRDQLLQVIAQIEPCTITIEACFNKKIERVFRSSEACQRIARIKGVGPKTATVIVAAIGDDNELKNGRHLAAWVGLVPRQLSSGQRTVLLGIYKRGSQHLRTLLVHGARSVVRTAARITDPFNPWVNQLHQRRGFN